MIKVDCALKGKIMKIDKGEDEGLVTFESGILSSSTYSYEISSWGYIELSKKETRKVYEAMKKHFEKKGNVNDYKKIKVATSCCGSCEINNLCSLIKFELDKCENTKQVINTLLLNHCENYAAFNPEIIIISKGVPNESDYKTIQGAAPCCGSCEHCEYGLDYLDCFIDPENRRGTDLDLVCEKYKPRNPEK
jgi:hypothetical protein